MKVTVDISEKDMRDIMRFTGEKKKGPAIAKLVATSLMLQRRQEFSDEVTTGKWSVDLPDWRKTRARERERSRKLWER